MRKNPRRILSPLRLPFRHPGTAVVQNLARRESSFQALDCCAVTHEFDCFPVTPDNDQRQKEVRSQRNNSCRSNFFGQVLDSLLGLGAPMPIERSAK